MYLYLNISLFVLVSFFLYLQHGGVAFLYHPCVSNDTVDILREMAVSCLHRHVITPYERLNPCKVSIIKDIPVLILVKGDSLCGLSAEAFRLLLITPTSTLILLSKIHGVRVTAIALRGFDNLGCSLLAMKAKLHWISIPSICRERAS